MAKDAPTIQSVARAARILLAVADSKDGLAAKQVADRFELTLPTAYHLLTTLVEEGLLAKDAKRQYSLGPKAAVIADGVMRDTAPPRTFVEALEGLAAATGETAYLTAVRRGEIRVLATVEGVHAVRVGEIGTGFYGDAHARAGGKLLLAFADEDLRKRMLNGSRLKRLTPNTITTRAALEREFEQVREAGVAFDNEEFTLGVSCVSAPITAGDQVVAALTVSAPVDRMREHRDDYSEHARRAARTASV